MRGGNTKSGKTLVIVGCGAAGWSAALAARKADRRAHVIVLEQGSDPMYERGAIPFVLQGDIADFEALIHFPPTYYRALKVDLRTNSTVTQIDASAKTVRIVDPAAIGLRTRLRRGNPCHRRLRPCPAGARPHAG